MVALPSAWLCLCLAVSAAPRATAVGPELPAVTLAQGQALVKLTREGMKRYLTHRIRPREMPIPPALKGLAGRSSNPVAVTLRSGGSVVAVQVRAGDELCENLLAAALEAMRSPKLPDRVDARVLDALTVEVEVLSRLQPVEKAELAASVAAGLTGLAYARGERIDGARPPSSLAWVLPSAGYVLGFGADQMRRAAMLRFRLTPRNASLPPRLAIFTTRHYVGFPGTAAVELFRGKDMALRRGIDERALRAAAGKVGSYLLRHQDADGRFRQGEEQAPLRDHLYAAWAMARLAASLPEPNLAHGAAKAVACATGLLKRGEGKALVRASGRGETLAATALLSLALGEAAPDANTTRLRAELNQALLAELRGPGPTSAATRPDQCPEGPYLALLALAADGKLSDEARALGKALGQVRPGSFTAHLWACRAGVVPGILPTDPKQAAVVSQLGAAALPDEEGGFAVGARPPLVLRAGLAAACLARQLNPQDGRPGPSKAEADRLRGRLAAARRFCYGAMYQPREAYFSDDPNAWVGGVRATPACAAVSVSACAAAIEAFLAE